LLAWRQYRQEANPLLRWFETGTVSRLRPHFNGISEPIAVGLRQNEPAMLGAVNKALMSLETSGEMNAIFNKWLGPKTPYGLSRTDKVTPIDQLKFTPVS